MRAAVVVNAAGVWSDEVAGWRDEGDATRTPSARPRGSTSRCRRPGCRRRRRPCSRWRPTERSVFVIPWPGTDRVYIGTTDTDYDGDVDRARCSAADVAYLLAAVNPSLADPLTPADVVGCWAGLRPLVAGAGARGRTRRPVPPPPAVGVGGRGGHHHRRQAHDLPEDGRRHRRPRGRRARRRRPQPHRRLAPARRAGGRRVGLAVRHRVGRRCRAPPQAHRHLAQCGTPAAASGWPRGTAPSRAWSGIWWRPTARSANRWSTGSPTCGRRWCTPSATRWPVPSGTCSTAACAPASSTATARPRPRPTSPPWWDRSWAGPGPRPTPTWPSTGGPSTRSGSTPGSWPTTGSAPERGMTAGDVKLRIDWEVVVRSAGLALAVAVPAIVLGATVARDSNVIVLLYFVLLGGQVAAGLVRRPPPPRRPPGPRRPRLADVVPRAGRDRGRRPGHRRQERPRPLQPGLPRLHGLLHRHLRRPPGSRTTKPAPPPPPRRSDVAGRRVSHLVVDVGTSGVRAAIVGADASVSHVHHRQVLPTTPNQGFVEFDAALMAAAALEVARAALAAADGPVASVGIANQRASTVAVGPGHGRPRGSRHRLAGPAHGGHVPRPAGPGHPRPPQRLGHQARRPPRHRRPRPPSATCASAPSTRGWPGPCPAATSTSPTRPTPASPACSASTAPAGTPTSSTSSASRSG